MSRPSGHELVVLETVDSTMAEAARRSRTVEGPLWIMARRQTEGRGRRRRAWHSDPGNLAATLLLPDAGPPEKAALRSYVAALALRDTLVEISGRPDAFSLKWPNDVLLTSGKIAGILLERQGDTGALAVGFGVNLAVAPDPSELEADAVAPVALEPALGFKIAPEEFLLLLADAWANREGAFSSGGFEPIRAAWLAVAARLGQPVRARSGNRELRGIFETVDLAGNLVLKTEHGRTALPAAEIFF